LEPLRLVRRSASLRHVTDSTIPARASDDRAVTPVEPASSILRVVIVEASRIQHDGFIENLSKLCPKFIVAVFASLADCVSSSAKADVVLLRLERAANPSTVLDNIEELGRAFPGVPVLVLTED
jgi:hypothetical protein